MRTCQERFYSRPAGAAFELIDGRANRYLSSRYGGRVVDEYVSTVAMRVERIALVGSFFGVRIGWRELPARHRHCLFAVAGHEQLADIASGIEAGPRL